MDDETREAIRDIKEDNKNAHDEIKGLIKCLPCNIHSDRLSKHDADIAVLKETKHTTTTTTTTSQDGSKLDWKIVGILGTVITALVYLIEKFVNK